MKVKNFLLFFVLFLSTLQYLDKSKLKNLLTKILELQKNQKLSGVNTTKKEQTRKLRRSSIQRISGNYSYPMNQAYGYGGYNNMYGGGYNNMYGGGYNNMYGGGYNNMYGGGYNNMYGGGYNNMYGGGYNNMYGGGYNNMYGGGYNNMSGGGYNGMNGGAYNGNIFYGGGLYMGGVPTGMYSGYNGMYGAGYNGMFPTNTSYNINGIGHNLYMNNMFPNMPRNYEQGYQSLPPDNLHLNPADPEFRKRKLATLDKEINKIQKDQ